MTVNVDVPETRYAHGRGGDLAYQQFGAGPTTVIGLPPVVSNIEVVWEDPESRAWLRRLGSFTKVIHFDKRGQGLSDRISGVPTLEERVEDLTAVMDAAEVESAYLSGVSEGGLMAAFFAATHPERVDGLILVATFARAVPGDGYAHGIPVDVALPLIDEWEKVWATPDTMSVALMAADKLGDPEFLKWLNRFERASATPAGFAGALRLDLDLDIRHVLDQIRVPTLVIHRRDDALVSVDHGRYLADHIAGARFVELSGSAHAPWWGDNAMQIVAEMEQLITGQRGAEPDDRVLATVLFTDIVDSTAHAAELGDHRWTTILDEMDRLVTEHVSSARGRVVKGTGDGHLATFDGPARAVRTAGVLAHDVSERLGVKLRAGVHTGEIERRGDDIGGIAVHIAARVAARAGADQVLVSRTVTDLVAGSGLLFADAGVHALKGVPGEWQLFSVA